MVGAFPAGPSLRLAGTRTEAELKASSLLSLTAK